MTLKQDDYKAWLTALKQKFQQTQIKAAVQVNSTLLEFYWDLGGDIVEKQKNSVWGDGFLKQLSHDLMTEFPEIKGFSKRNLEQIRRWQLFWSEPNSIAKQAASQLFQIPWWHHVVILAKCKNKAEALYYVQQTQIHGWSRSVLTHQIESGLWQREGKAINNFERTLPAIQSDLAQQTLKDPYVFDFLALTKSFNELKTTDFEPEHAGKLNFYIKAVDELLRTENDQATIGILLCKKKDRLVAEYALSDIQKPMGVSEYQLTQSLPKNLQSKLPSIEAIEKELAREL